MVGFTAVRQDMAKERMNEYTVKLDTMNLKELVAEFFSYLDYTEETESGRIIHPITISSCRILMSEPLSKLLTRLRQCNDLE